MAHKYTVTDNRIEGPVFRAGKNIFQMVLFEFSAIVIEFVAIIGLTGWSDLSGRGKCLGIGLLCLGFFCHLYPFLSQKWFVMDDGGVWYHAFRKHLHMSWETIRCVALQTTERRFNKTDFVCFSTDESCPPISKTYLEVFNDNWFGVQYRPEIVAFVVRRAKNAVLTDDREESIRERRSGR